MGYSCFYMPLARCGIRREDCTSSDAIFDEKRESALADRTGTYGVSRSSIGRSRMQKREFGDHDPTPVSRRVATYARLLT